MTSKHSPGVKAKSARGPDTRRDTRKPARPLRLRHIYEEDEYSFHMPDTVLGSGEK